MSRLDQALGIAFNHQTVIVEILFAIILGIVVVWLFTSLRQDNSGDSGLTGNINELESMLKRILESTAGRPSTAADAAMLIHDEDAEPAKPTLALKPMTGIPGVDPAELLRLRTDLEFKSKKLEELEKALGQAQAEAKKASDAAAAAAANASTATSAAPAAGGGVNLDELNNKVKALEARLAEYEIIEDDIANLSLYKEENARLKSELDRLSKGAGGATGSPPAADSSSGADSSVTAVPQAPAVDVPPVVEAAAQAAAPANPAPSANPAESPIDSDKLLKEFDTLVSASPDSAPGKEGAKDSSEKLIEEFENFMKGSGS